MRSSITFVAAAILAASSVAAHGKIASMTGDMGGNGTALGIQGAVVPGPGKNKVTEVDTTVFKGDQKAGCGKTSTGDNTMDAGVKQAMALSGGSMPMVSEGGSINGVVHVVTSDGFGPYTALVDPSGTGDFSAKTKMEVTTQVPGTRLGNGKKTTTKRFEELLRRAGILARATNINEDFPIQATMPAGVKCTGTVGGMENVCMVKLVNPSPAGPFGGCVAVQMAPAGAAAPPPPARKMRAVRM